MVAPQVRSSTHATMSLSLAACAMGACCIACGVNMGMRVGGDAWPRKQSKRLPSLCNLYACRLLRRVRMHCPHAQGNATDRIPVKSLSDVIGGSVRLQVRHTCMHATPCHAVPCRACVHSGVCWMTHAADHHCAGCKCAVAASTSTWRRPGTCHPRRQPKTTRPPPLRALQYRSIQYPARLAMVDPVRRWPRPQQRPPRQGPEP